MKAARDARPVEGRPQIVLPATAHPAFHKAAHYLGMEIAHVPVDGDFRADPAATAAALTPRTVLVVASAPSYPHGVMDPVPEIAALAARRGRALPRRRVRRRLGAALAAGRRTRRPAVRSVRARGDVPLMRPAQVRLLAQGGLGRAFRGRVAPAARLLRVRALARLHGDQRRRPEQQERRAARSRVGDPHRGRGAGVPRPGRERDEGRGTLDRGHRGDPRAAGARRPRRAARRRRLDRPRTGRLRDRRRGPRPRLVLPAAALLPGQPAEPALHPDRRQRRRRPAGGAGRRGARRPRRRPARRPVRPRGRARRAGPRRRRRRRLRRPARVRRRRPGRRRRPRDGRRQHHPGRAAARHPGGPAGPLPVGPVRLTAVSRGGSAA
ncbi:aminotransferase class V-fold PLP-dependent enzyme [Actinomadura madurae]|uniref:aminotransferase class V-fold PLP-dependent enzyme n=1 Tax=Actinomadura madurae TaxID=1993 RepID=UPI003FD87957